MNHRNLRQAGDDQRLLNSSASEYDYDHLYILDLLELEYNHFHNQKNYRHYKLYHPNVTSG